jgi:hypothetical protein
MRPPGPRGYRWYRLKRGITAKRGSGRSYALVQALNSRKEKGLGARIVIGYNDPHQAKAGRLILNSVAVGLSTAVGLIVLVTLPIGKPFLNSS